MPIKPKPLTETKIKRSFYREGGKNRFPDENGVSLVLLPDGRKLWAWRGTLPGRKKRTQLHIGYYPQVDRAAAQRKAVELRGGKLPETLGTFCLGWMERNEPRFAPRTATTFRGVIGNDILPALGHRPVADLTHKVVLEFLLPLEPAGKRHRVRDLLGMILDDAVIDEILPSNPARSIPKRRLGERPSVKHRAAILDRGELGRFLRAVDGYAGFPQTRGLLLFLMLTACRPTEARLARWKDIDLEAGLWRRYVPKTKTEHVCPLSKQVLGILNELEPLTGHLPGPFYRSETRMPLGDQTPIWALRSLGYPKDVMSCHGCRAIFRTLGDEIGIDPLLLEMQLSHKMPGPLGRAYSRFERVEERREAMQRWADFLDELRGQS